MGRLACVAYTDTDQLAVNVIRGLSMDMPQAAKSGHPGTAMALAPLAHVLFTRVMRHDPANPSWPDRDRFVLSCGHASPLIYSILHLAGYGLTINDLKRFRTLGSSTPGHPEVHHTTGVEVTTGPLGAGFSNAVGMAIAEAHMRAVYGPEVCDHHIYGICSDGDMQEGISHEAASLAGHLGLGRIVFIYDDNHITIDGDTELSYSDNVPERFLAYNWEVIELGESANDLDKLEQAIRLGAANEEKPTLIVLRSHIGYPSSKQDTAAAHGSPLGDDVVAETKKALGLSSETFHVPDEVYLPYRKAAERGADEYKHWEASLEALTEPGMRAGWDAAQAGTGLEGWEENLPSWEPGDKVATRAAGAKCVNALAAVVPGLVAGGADLTGNTGVALKSQALSKDNPAGRLIHFGIREHGMGGAMVGMAHHKGLLPVGGTFFVFSDYMRGSVRLAALSQAKVIFSWTHDSIGVGEDGPTHQPIEHLASLRAMPGLRLIRPADANEVAHAYRIAIESDGPTAIVMSRQDLPVLDGTKEAYEGVRSGAYVLIEDEEADVTLVSTGSEVHLCVNAVDGLAKMGINARVVSMPSWDLFDETDDEYQGEVLPDDIPVLSVEAGSTFGWDRWAEDCIGIDAFGTSANVTDVFEHFGFTASKVAERAASLVQYYDELAEAEGEEDHEYEDNITQDTY